jgi:pilus assembly protein Flp/PilA
MNQSRLFDLTVLLLEPSFSMLKGIFSVDKAPPEKQPERESMRHFATSLKRFLVSEDGPTAVEYAVMLALIIVVCLTAIQAVGTNANNKFNQVQNALT